MNNEIQIRLSYEKDTFTGKDVVNFLLRNDFLGFEPKKIRSTKLKLNNSKFSKEHFDLLAKVEKELRFDLESQNFVAPRFSVGEGGFNGDFFQFFNWTISYESYLKLNLTDMFNEKLITGYVFDSEYEMWESMESIHNYKYFNKSYEHLPKKWNKSLNENEIDISNNPGRLGVKSGMWIGTGWRMYFGKKFYSFVSKDKLLSFKGAHQILELPNDIVYIELYKNVFESNKDENKELQRSFRKWIMLDTLFK